MEREWDKQWQNEMSVKIHGVRRGGGKERQSQREMCDECVKNEWIKSESRGKRWWDNSSAGIDKVECDHWN